jgi:hypothetical protein
MADMTPFDASHRRLRLVNVTLEQLPGEDLEYRVKPTGAAEASWEAFERLEDAEARGLTMAPKQRVVRAGKRPKRVYRSIRAKMRAMRNSHNRKMRARLLRGITKAD